MLDIITVTLLAIAALRGFRKGAIVAVFSLVALVLGVVFALKLSGALASWMAANGWASAGWASLLSYVILFIGIGFLIRMGGRMISRTADILLIGIFNRLAGAALFMLAAVFAWSAVLLLCTRLGIINEAGLKDSLTYPYVAPVAPWLLEKMSVILPFIKGMMSDLDAFADGMTRRVDSPR